jgi:hypothetical protein
MYFPPNELVPAEEKNPKPLIFQLQIRLDIPGSPLHGFRFQGPMFRALMGLEPVSCALYNFRIFDKKVVPDSYAQLSHHFLIVYRTNFKSDPSGMNRCLRHCTSGLIQTPWAGPVMALKFMGFSFLFY